VKRREQTVADETRRGIRLVADVFRRVSASVHLDETLEAILDGAKSLLDYDAAGVYVVEPASKRLLGHRTRGYRVEPGSNQLPFEGKGILEEVLASGRPRLLNELPTSEGLSGRPSARTALVAPFVGNSGRVVGAIYLESDRDNAYGSSTLDLLGALAAGVTGAIERDLLYQQTMEQRRLEGEVMVARQVMARLLPRELPRLGGFDIAAVSRPCYEVGGDYYDVIPLGNDRWSIAIADVAGKGVAAALLVAAMRASLYLMAGHELALRGVLSRANRFLHESAGKKFVTLFYAVMDLQIRRLIYVNAAHLPPVLVRADGEVERLQEGGVPLGPFEAPRYFEGFAKLETGDVLALYTDGVTEAMDARGEEYGEERLSQALSRVRAGSAQEICDSDAHHADDQTLVVFKAT
jgi:serine phosphatase RsbU (regulator of sigma subunit)